MLLDPSRIHEISQKRNHPGYLLITGATGFLGQYLLRDLTLAGFQLAVLVRPSKRDSAEYRIEELMQRWDNSTGVSLSRPVVLQGSITEQNLGLSTEDIDWVGAHVESVLHSAALLQFHGDPASEPWTTNVGGTRNVIDLAKRAGISHIQYVSTAYSCGLQDEVVYEDWLDRDQKFRNDYEHSKFDAEMLVRNSGIKNVTVFRPSVIVGDSQTGFTCSYHGLYVYLRLMSLLIPNLERDENGVAHTKIRLPFTGHERRNLVPVDWVSSVITKLVSNKQAHGRTFHLTPDESITPRELIEYCYNYFNTTGVEYVGASVDSVIDSSEPSDADCDSEFAAKFLKNTGMYHAYDTSDPEFDRSNLKRFAGDIECPVLDEATVHRFIKYGENDNWGKHKRTPTESQFWLVDHLDELASSIESVLRQHRTTSDANVFEVGINIAGSGGAQRTFCWDGESVVHRKGVSSSADILIEFDSEKVLEQLGEHDGCWNSLIVKWLNGIVPNESVNRVA